MLVGRGSRFGARRAGALALAVALVAGGGVAIGASGDTALISRESASAGGDGANGASGVPSVSGDGRFIAFATEADNLGGPRDPGVKNVYLYDVATAETELVSRRGKKGGGDGADGDSTNPSISADGRFVAFETEASNLGGPAVTGRRCQPDTRSCSNIYVYDTRRSRVRLVSRQSEDDGGRGADADSIDPAISADGLSVAFETYARNLGGPVQGQSNVYVYDRDRDSVALVSRQSAADGGEGGDPGGAGTPSISGDGRFVAFWTNDDNLGGPKTAFNAIYVYDRDQREVTLVSRQSAGDGGAGAVRSSYDPSISADGRFVAFFTYAGNLGGPVQFPGNVYVYDLQQQTVELASRQSDAAGGAGADGLADSPSISADGSAVAFLTQATNLGGAIASTRNVYVYDRASRRVELASRQGSAAGGQGADRDSWDPALAGDGASVAFATGADNLGGPARDVANVYRHERDG